MKWPLQLWSPAWRFSVWPHGGTDALACCPDAQAWFCPPESLSGVSVAAQVWPGFALSLRPVPKQGLDLEGLPLPGTLRNARPPPRTHTETPGPPKASQVQENVDPGEGPGLPADVAPRSCVALARTVSLPGLIFLV